LQLSFDDGGALREVRLADKRLPLSGPGGFSIAEARSPDGAVAGLGSPAGKVSRRGGTVRLEACLPEAGLELAAAFRGGKFIDVRGEVRDLTGIERALKVTFTLPVKLSGWRWENTAFSARKIRRGSSYPLLPDDVMWLDRRGEGFLNEDHAPYTIPLNKLPFSAVCRGKAGLALAYPLHEPRVFMIRVTDAGYSISFSLGLSPETQKFPSRASFRFAIYTVDPEWGIRSAAERYYQFFPELVAGCAKRHGNFGFFFPDKFKDRPEDFGWAYMENDFQWKNGEMSEEQEAAAKRLGTDVVHWRNPWVFHTPLDLAPGPETTSEECLKLLQDWAQSSRGSHGQNCGTPLAEAARAALNSHLIDEQGRFMRGVHEKGAKPYWVFPMNMDPELPKPNRYTIATEWQYRYLDLWKKPGFRGPRGFAWDATDDFDSFRRLNFRREHFRTVSAPLTFDPRTGRLCQVKGFGDWEFASRFTPRVRAAGGFIMANTTIEQSMMFLGAHIDVFIRERALADNNEERLSVMRMLAGRKPVSFIGHWQPRDEAGLREATDKALLFGIAPGADGPAKESEAVERAVLRTRMPVLAKMAAAGWQPVTCAEAKGLCIERFGAVPGSLFFAVGNRGGRKVAARVALDLRALGLGGQAASLQVSEILQGREVRIARSAGRLLVNVPVGPKETVVLSVRGERK
jgi:hypothetical protein